jgi:hypothetical protein
METGSLVTSPSPIRYVTLSDDSVSYTSEPIDSVVGIPDFQSFAQDYLMQGLTGQVPGMLMGITPSRTEAAAAALAATDITDGVTLGQFLAACMAKHYAGDETPEPYGTLIAAMQSYSAGDDDTNQLYRLLGNAAWALANDTTGDLTENPAPDTVPDNAGSLTLSALPAYNDDEEGGGDGGGGTPAASHSAGVSGGGSVPISVNTAAGSAALDLGSLAGRLAGGGNIAVTVPSIPGVNTFTAELPASALTSGPGSLTLNTGVGSVTLPGDMLSGTGVTDNASITISEGDKDSLPGEVRAAVGDRPLIRLTLEADGEQTDWSNPDSPVTVSVPYTPTAAERANPESIVVWYIDGSGNAQCVTNGHYDPLRESNLLCYPF